MLRGVELEVPAGSLTAVLGLSGCGKTTLLRVIAGFERAERGDGRARRARRSTTAARYVAARAARHRLRAAGGRAVPAPDVAGNVGFGLPRAERRGARSRELLELVGIAALGARLPHELSGGEQQRVALARALARRPQALLLDEPFSSLDASLRARVREEVHELLREQGVTTVLVTHDQEEALSLADRVAVLRDGRIVQQGAPAELYERPADARAGALPRRGQRARGRASSRRTAADAARRARAARAAPPARPAAGLVMVRPEQLDVRAALAGERRRGGRRAGASSSAATTATTRCCTSAAEDGRGASCCWRGSTASRRCRSARA